MAEPGPSPARHPSSLPVEHLFTLTASVSRAATITDGPSGTRVIVECTDGRFEGGRLKGEAVAPSGDWVRLGADGSMWLDVRMLLRTDDGAEILMTYGGVSADRGSTIRAAPSFETGDERYVWLNAVQAVATGESGDGRVTYEVYRLL
jgi:hypothetical protein